MRKATVAFLLLLATAVFADDFSYVFKGPGRAVISGNMNVETVLATRDRYSGDFLWVRRSGREYLIRDAATIAEARAAFAEADALHAEYHALETRMRPVEERERERELEEQVDRIGDRLSDDEDLSHAERMAGEERLRKLEVQLASVQRELRVLEKEEERLDAREEKLVAIAERELREIVARAIERGAAERLR